MGYTEDYLEFLQEYMAVNAITAKTICGKIGCTKSALSKWLSGKTLPTIGYIEKTADVMGCSTDYLLGLQENKSYIAAAQKTTFLKRLECLSKEFSFSKYRISKECDIGNSAVSKWTKGKIPKVDTVVKLSRLFNCSVDYLIGRSDLT